MTPIETVSDNVNINTSTLLNSYVSTSGDIVEVRISNSVSRDNPFLFIRGMNHHHSTTNILNFL